MLKLVPITRAAKAPMTWVPDAPAFKTIPHTDPAAKDVPWSKPGEKPPADFKGWLNADRNATANNIYFRYWDGSAWHDGGSTANRLRKDHPHGLGPVNDMCFGQDQIYFRPIHPVFLDQS